MEDQEKGVITPAFKTVALNGTGLDPEKVAQALADPESDPETLAVAVRALSGVVAELQTELEETKQALNEAGHDVLTGLPGRKLFLEKVTDTLKQVDRYDNKQAVVVLMDLDGFKEVNDECGHQAGDDALVEVGKRLSGMMRETDAIGRWGGDEIVMLLTYDFGESFNEQAVTLRIREALAGLYYGEKEKPYPVGTSIGFAVIDTDTMENPPSRQEAERFIGVADQAMYLDKDEKPQRQAALRQAIIDSVTANDTVCAVAAPFKMPGPGGS